MQTLAAGRPFAFIGAGRAGSTWFYEVLREHPSVIVPPNKGTFYFSGQYERGFDWYRSFFPQSPRDVAVGEVCEDYLSHPEALRRIRTYRPEIRLICCLRNPYERALSAWRFFGRSGILEPSLVAQAASRPDIFEQGYYATHLARLMSLFPQEQVLIFFFEELTRSPEEVVRRAYEFIGVDPEFAPEALSEKVNSAATARVPFLARAAHATNMYLRRRSYLSAKAIEWVKGIRPLRHWIRSTLYVAQPGVGAWRAHLAEFPDEVVARYESEIDVLERMLRRDFSGWRICPSSASRET